MSFAPAKNARPISNFSPRILKLPSRRFKISATGKSAKNFCEKNDFENFDENLKREFLKFENRTAKLV